MWCDVILQCDSFPLSISLLLFSRIIPLHPPPPQEYRANGAVGVLKALRRESLSLLKTVTRETLTASSKVSHFLANTLIDLVTPEGAVPSNRRQREAGGGRAHRNEKQPTGFTGEQR
jgi:hypothetical protein